MTTISPQAVWEAANQEDGFPQQPEAAREALRPFIEALPTILANVLETPITISSVMSAKIAFTKYCLNNNFIGAVLAATPPEILQRMGSPEELAEQMGEMMNHIIVTAEEVVADVPAILQRHGVTEQAVMMGQQFGLNQASREQYLAGKLTIGQLIVTQPSVIFSNTR